MLREGLRANGDRVELNGKVALVTGAASGIGRGVAVRLAREGATVAALDRSADAAPALLDELARVGERDHLFLTADVRVADQVEAAVAELVERLGRIDILVCSAGVREIGDVYDLAPEEWENVIAVNLTGTFWCCQAVAKRMRSVGTGSIVTLASVGGLIGLSHRPAYTAAKHGVVGLTRSLARDLGADGIRVNAVCPGVIRTPLTEQYWDDEGFEQGMASVVPLGRSGTVADVEEAVLYLASERAAYVSGIALTVDGGWLAEKGFAAGQAGTSDGSAFHRPRSTTD